MDMFSPARRFVKQDLKAIDIIAKLSPVPAPAWAEMVLVPDNPGRPADRPSGIVLSSSNTALKSKVKMFYTINRTQKYCLVLALQPLINSSPI